MSDWLWQPTPRPGASFVVRRIPPLRESKGLGAVDGAHVLQVRLVPDDHDRYVLVVLDAYDVAADRLELLERRLGTDAEDQEEPMPRFHVEISHGN